MGLLSIRPVLDVPGSDKASVFGINEFVKVDEVEVLVFCQVFSQWLQTLLFAQDLLKQPQQCTHLLATVNAFSLLYRSGVGHRLEIVLIVFRPRAFYIAASLWPFVIALLRSWVLLVLTIWLVYILHSLSLGWIMPAFSLLDLRLFVSFLLPSLPPSSLMMKLLN